MQGLLDSFLKVAECKRIVRGLLIPALFIRQRAARMNRCEFDGSHALEPPVCPNLPVTLLPR
jgi:hypothetical protein